MFITEDSVVSSPIFHDERIYLQTNNEFRWFSTISTNLEGCFDLDSGGFCDG